MTKGQESTPKKPGAKKEPDKFTFELLDNRLHLAN
jgi:hypothetical protein